MNPARVLVVDDNAANLKLVSFLLRGRGFDVATAADAEEALEQIARVRPDLILMDLQLPGMDGLTLTRQLKATEGTRDIIIVAVTAYAMKGDEATARAAGCDDYVTKPIDTRTLPGRLLGLLTRVSDGSPSAEAPKVPEAPRVERRSGLLVVEDNAITRRVVRFALERAGFSVIEAASGEDAIAAFQGHDVSLVLQDLRLGDMDGFELLQRLREQTRGAEVPILAFSGMLSVHDGSRITAAGFDDVVVKPIEPARLVQIVRSHLPDGQAASDGFGRGRRLLVVDDDPVQRKLVAYRIAKAGFNVNLAGDGEEALSLARVHPPDVILSDVLMPRLDGFGLCLAVARDPELRRVPIILTTNSYVEPVDRELAHKVGARDLVLRTPDLREVFELLRRSLGADSRTVPRPNLQGEHALAVDREHTQRMAAQLERHVALNARMSQRTALLSAEVLVIRGITEALASHEDIDTALTMAIAACFDAGQVTLGGLLVLGENGPRIVTSHGRDTPGASELERLLLREDVLRDLEPGKTLLMRGGDARGGVLLEQTKATNGVLAPLVYNGRRFGALLMLTQVDESEELDRTNFCEAVAGQVSQALAVAEAFRERAASERNAVEQTALLSSIFESLADGLVVVDERGQVIRTNAPGRPLAALVTARDDSPTGLFGADRVTRLPFDGSPLGRAIRGESVDGVEVFARLGEAEGRWFSASARPWLRGNTPVGAVGIFRDVTQDKATQSHLMTSDRMASVGLLAAGVAHEINNPLASVLTNLEVARKDTLRRLENGDQTALRELDEILADAREAADRVHHIVRDLKIFSRHEEQKDGVSDVHAVIESTLRMANNEIRHRARLVKELCPVDLVDGTESRLGQVFLNLIVNAAQAIPEGNAGDHTLKVSTRQEGGRVLVAVSDTGVGIGTDALRRLFLPFYTTKAPGAGTGLGLAISHSIVSGLGGDIRVESEVGRGTTFTVSLPIAKTVKRRDPISNTSASQRVTPRGKILVIDDEPLIGLSIKRLLGRQHDVVALTNAREALELLRGGERFDVMLCDLMMPQMTGMDFHAALVGLDRAMAHEVIFLTGGAFTPAARTFLDEVPNVRLNKPFGANDLKQLIDERVKVSSSQGN